jgi:pimeloyl-ACP methyl ester carboxylesterase
MATPSTLEYTELPARTTKIVEENLFLGEAEVKDEVAKFRQVKPRPADHDGDTEVIEGVTFTHHFILGPGDAEVIEWHYVETGPKDAEAVVFLHGIPDAWYQWHMQMAKLSTTYRCIAPDLKGYGQSTKNPGDYRHEGAGEQVFQMLQLIGAKRFNLVTHDRGTCQADFIAANHPQHVLRYARGEQHLFHFNPALAPQGEIFMNAAYNGVMDDPTYMVVWAHLSLDVSPIAPDKLARCIQEFSYPGIARAVPRYFNSSSFRIEWLQRRNRLLEAWTCPVLILQGYHSKTQPREFYEGISHEHIPNAKSVNVTFLPGGHFWPLECPAETTEALVKFFKS